MKNKVYELPYVEVTGLPDAEEQKAVRRELNEQKPGPIEWMPEYDSHIKSRPVSLPIKIHPLLMCDKDTAIAEYDRLYEILKVPYVEILKNDGQSEADMFVNKVISMYIDLWIDIRSYNDESRQLCASDSKKMKHYANIVKNAVNISIAFDSDDRIKAIYAQDDNDHRVRLSRQIKQGMEEGVNDRLFNDIASGLENVGLCGGSDKILITNANKRWDSVQKILYDAVQSRILYEPDVRAETKEMALKCRPLYRYLTSFRKEFGINPKNYSHAVGDMVKRITLLNIDTRRLVEIIQGKN